MIMLIKSHLDEEEVGQNVSSPIGTVRTDGFLPTQLNLIHMLFWHWDFPHGKFGSHPQGNPALDESVACPGYQFIPKYELRCELHCGQALSCGRWVATP